MLLNYTENQTQCKYKTQGKSRHALIQQNTTLRKGDSTQRNCTYDMEQKNFKKKSNEYL